MKNIKSVVTENLISLRKKNKFTQIELAKLINFSDKAISRWENGDVVPDIETLEKLSKIYQVPITYFFEEHTDVAIRRKNRPSYNDLLLQLITICVIWVVLTIVFVSVRIIYDYTFWQVFVWGVPITSMLLLKFTKSWCGNLLRAIFRTVLTWSLLASIYLQLLEYNLWLIFLVGVPIQAGIFLAAFSKPKPILEDDHSPQVEE